MTRRVLVPSAAPGSRVLLDPKEARHLVRVLRAAPGLALEAVDPSGRRYRAVLVSADPATVEIGEPLPLPLPGPALLFAPPKGARADWLVEKAVELGASSLRPVLTGHGAVREVRLDRWRRLAEAAAKQSGGAIPELLPMVPLEAALAALKGPLVSADPSGEEAVAISGAEALAVGPEGGWSDGELELLRKRGRLVSLGPRILRVETAALAMLALALPG